MVKTIADSMEWKYIGEKGAEIQGRNSHSLGIVRHESTNYLVVYGGASSEFGVFSNTFYAELPALEQIGNESI